MNTNDNSLGYKNFNDQYASEQREAAAREANEWTRRIQSAKHDLEEAEEQLIYWEGVRDFYKKAKEAEQ